MARLHIEPYDERDTPFKRLTLPGFPRGTHDDQVDALGLVGQLMDKMVSGAKPKPQTQSQISGYSAHNRSRPRSDSILTL